MVSPPLSPKHAPTGKRAKKMSQKEQSERFLETARALSADETGKAFDSAISVIAVAAPKRRV